MSVETIDFEQAGFLEGLSGTARAERIELLEWLVDEGFSFEELTWGHRHGVLPFLAAGREIGGPRLYTVEQVATESNIDVEYLIRLRRAQGLPVPDRNEPVMSELDLRVACDLHGWITHGFDQEQIIATTRAIGSNIARATEAMRAALFELVVAPGASEKQIAETYAQTTAALMPSTDELIVGLTRQHLRNIIQTELAGAIDAAAGREPGSTSLTVAFADLVGFTRLGEELPPEDLSRVADELVEIAQELLTEPVRFIKGIGDAVLLTSPDPAALVDFGLRLCTYVEERGHETPQIRVGVASGAVVARHGDVFGGPVNVANRITSVARAGSVLATAAVQEACSEDFKWSLAGIRRLKGLPPMPLFRARPPTTHDLVS